MCSPQRLAVTLWRRGSCFRGSHRAALGPAVDVVGAAHKQVQGRSRGLAAFMRCCFYALITCTRGTLVLPQRNRVRHSGQYERNEGRRPRGARELWLPPPGPCGALHQGPGAPQTACTARSPGSGGRGAAQPLAGRLCSGRPGLKDLDCWRPAACGLAFRKAGGERNQEDVCTSHSRLTEEISEVLSDLQRL